jgi:hypothetical protein
MLKEKLKKISTRKQAIHTPDLVKETMSSLSELSKEYKSEDIAKVAYELDGVYIDLILYLAVLGNKETEIYLKKSIKKHSNNKKELFACALGLSALLPDNKFEIFKNLGLDIDLRYSKKENNPIRKDDFIKYLINNNSFLFIRQQLEISDDFMMLELDYFLRVFEYSLKEYTDDKEIARLAFEIDITTVMLLAMIGNKETEKYLRLSMKNINSNNDDMLDCAAGLAALDIDEGFEKLEEFNQVKKGSPNYTDVYDYLEVIDNPRANKMKEDIKRGKYGKFVND